MRGGALPPALLFAALGLALAFAHHRVWAPSLLGLLSSAGASSFLPFPPTWLEGIYLVFWISVIATAAGVHFVNERSPSMIAIALSINAGVWASAVVHLSGSWTDMLIALPFTLIVFGASWVIHRYNAIPVKVVSSWIIAVAVLAAMLQMLTVTPGYLPDHLE